MATEEYPRPMNIKPSITREIGQPIESAKYSLVIYETCAMRN